MPETSHPRPVPFACRTRPDDSGYIVFGDPAAGPHFQCDFDAPKWVRDTIRQASQAAAREAELAEALAQILRDIKSGADAGGPPCSPSAWAKALESVTRQQDPDDERSLISPVP
jgi:hypothetical protein